MLIAGNWKMFKGAHEGLQFATTIRHLPEPVHAAFISVFAESLRPVFLVAAAIGVLAFCLSWFLREMPLRTTTGAVETAGETLGLEEAA